uniref:hypothetical protein n=1 Tax=Nonomuraea sp. CA-251285 TaxID=3240002 RepID=UPI003F494465
MNATDVLRTDMVERNQPGAAAVRQARHLPAEHVAGVVLDAVAELLDRENLAMKVQDGHVEITRWRE